MRKLLEVQGFSTSQSPRLKTGCVPNFSNKISFKHFPPNSKSHLALSLSCQHHLISSTTTIHAQCEEALWLTDWELFPYLLRFRLFPFSLPRRINIISLLLLLIIFINRFRFPNNLALCHCGPGCCVCLRAAFLQLLSLRNYSVNFILREVRGKINKQTKNRSRHWLAGMPTFLLFHISRWTLKVLLEFKTVSDKDSF